MRGRTRGCEILGIGLCDRQIEQFNDYANLIADANKKINLTSIKTEDIVQLHFLDSLLCCQAVRLNEIGTLIDVGSGAGFPGLVLKIAFPHLSVTLLDATNKKVGFLDYCCSKLKLKGVHTLHGRAEDLVENDFHLNSYDLATARALDKLPTLIRMLFPFIKQNGSVLAIKSENIEEEIRSCHDILLDQNGTIEKIVSTVIPNTSIARKLIVLKHL